MKKSKTAKLGISIALAFSISLNVLASNSSPLLETEWTHEQKVQIALSDYTLEKIPESFLNLLDQGAVNSGEEQMAGWQTQNQSDVLGEPNGQTSAGSSAARKRVRLSEDRYDDLTSVVFENNDGTKTIHQFPVNIKYIDINGKVRFKDTALAESNTINGFLSTYAFEDAGNDVKTFYPKQINQCVRLEYYDIKVEMKPVCDLTKQMNRSTLQAAKDAEKIEKALPAVLEKSIDSSEVVAYKNAFGSNTALQYTPALNGLKENIVLEAYTGQNEFVFDLNLGNLHPAVNEGASIVLLDETGAERAVIGTVDARDSFGGDHEYDYHKTLNNFQRIEKLDDKGSYRLTVVVDKEFLEAPSTVYPVIVDPTITVTGYYLWDTTAYSGLVRDNHTDSYNQVGTNLTLAGKGNVGTGRMWVNWYYVSNYKYLNPNLISSVKFKVREGSGRNTPETIVVNKGSSTWDQVNVSFNQAYDTQVTSLTLNGAGWYYFNITSAFRDWLRYVLEEGGRDERCGFVLRHVTAGTQRHFHSTENSLPPSFEITYTEDNTVETGTYFLRSQRSDKYVDVKSGSVDNSARIHQWSKAEVASQAWYVEKTGDGVYKIQSVNSEKVIDVIGDDDVDSVKVVQYRDSGNPDQRWRIIKNGDGSFRIMSMLSRMRGLDVIGGQTDDGKELGIYTYYGNTNQKWYLERGAVVQNYYDKGYQQRWGSEALSKLVHYEDLARNMYYNQCKIRFVFYNINYTSVADNCLGVSASTIDQLCPHGLNGYTCGLDHPNKLHHKFTDFSRADNMGLSKTSQNKPGYKCVSWMGHVTCDGGCVGSGYKTGAAFGVTYPPGNDIVICSWVSPKRNVWSSTTLLHELGHAMGVGGNQVDTVHNANCVMSYFYKEDFYLEEAMYNRWAAGNYSQSFCTACKNSLLSLNP